MRPESARITKLETYLRVDQDDKHAIKRCLGKSENLLDVVVGSEIEVWKRRDREGWIEARVTSDRWSRPGLDPLDVDAIEDGEETEKRLERELKIYQMTDWAEHDRDGPIAHPKLEASLASGSAHLSEWDDVLDSLRHLALCHLECAGVDDGDIVADHYFKSSVQPTTEFVHPKGHREDLRRYYSRFEAVA
jgi:hypothetical protein